MNKKKAKKKKIKKSVRTEVVKKAPNTQGKFPVVGIGASAGGLEVFVEIFKALPIDTGMAFVIIQHLDPTHESLTAEILSRATKMPVYEIRNGAYVKPNHVYVIPANYDLEFIHGNLKLLPRQKATDGRNLVINSFLQSLAIEQKEKAIGIILSGTASDGTLGLRAIKFEGGITIAQDSKSTKFSGMPESAMASGAVDMILNP